MKKLIKPLLLATIVAITSCQNPEKEATNVVDNFINEVNEHGASKYQGSLKKSREALNYSFVSADLEKLIRNNFIGSPDKEKYKLTVTKSPDDTYLVTSIGFEGTLEEKITFKVSKINDEWKISDAYNLVGLYLNFRIEDTQWDTYWDLKKANILQEITDSLELEIIKRGYKSYYGGAMKGNLRLINNSNYDLKSIEVLIEHFDKNGKSVNTDNTTVYDIIRSKGYREFDWYTSDCAKCVTQTFKIKFVRKTIK